MVRAKRVFRPFAVEAPCFPFGPCYHEQLFAGRKGDFEKILRFLSEGLTPGLWDWALPLYPTGGARLGNLHILVDSPPALKRGQAPFVRSTLRAVPANGA